VAGHWIFGAQLQPFNTYTRAFTTLFLSLVGGFPYDTMRKVAPVSALVFSTAWVVVVVFVLTNVFISIMTEWYRQVCEEEKDLDEKIAAQVGKGALEILSMNVLQVRLGQLYAKMRGLPPTPFEELLQEAAEVLKDADLANLDYMRSALIEGKSVDVKAITTHFSSRVDDDSLKQAYDVVEKVKDMKTKAGEVEEAAGEACDEDEGGTAENEREEQEELQKLQTTVQRLEAQLKELRSALRQSDKAPLLEGQAPEGYMINPAPDMPVPAAPDTEHVTADAALNSHGIALPMIPGSVPEHKQPAGGGVGNF